MRIKRFLSLFICVLMITAIFGVTTTAGADTAWDGTTQDTSWYTGNTSAAYYTISTGAQLAGLAKLTNEGNDFTGKTIILTQDIDLGDHDWTPIGNTVLESGDAHTYPFNGTFEGGGFDITGLVIGTNASPNTTMAGTGLFGLTDVSTIIKNISVDIKIFSTYLDLTNKTEFSGGGIVGNNNGIIINCHASGTITGSQGCSGGIAGRMGGGAIYNCYSSATVTGFLAGGITGWGWDGSIINCYATGVIAGSGSAGGLIGYVYVTHVTNGYWNSSATPIGYNGSGMMHNVIGLINTQMQGIVPVSITYYNSSINTSSTVTGYNLLDALNGGRSAIPAFTDGTPANSWGGDMGAYPTLISSAITLPASADIGSVTGTAKIAASVLYAGDHLAYTLGDTLDWPDKGEAITGTSYTSGANISAAAGQYLCLYELDASNKAVAFYWIKLTANDIRRDIDLPGSGTSADPFIVSSLTDLQKLRTMINDNGKTYSGKVINLTSNIDLSGVANWTPIGNDTNIFYGTFDGKGYAIRNMTITNCSSNDALFGGIEDGAIKNLSVENVNINTDARYNAAAIVGYGYDASIINCRATGSITASANDVTVGGITGYLNGGSIFNCVSTVAITATGSNCCAGGIAGGFEDASVKNCYATPDINAGNGSYGGGFTGYSQNSNIINCYARGDVTGGTYAGGLVGSTQGKNHMANCYATGNVTAAKSGGLAGGLDGNSDGGSDTDTIEASYWNSTSTQTVNGTVQDAKAVGATNKSDIQITVIGKSLADMKTADLAGYLNNNITSLSIPNAVAWKQAAGINNSLPYLTGIGSVPAISASVSAGTVIGATKITAAASSGNSLKYVVSSSSLGTPVIPDTLGVVAPAAKAYTSGANISGVAAGKYIGLYEVNAGGTIQRFKLITLTSANVKTLMAPGSFKAVPVSYNSIKLTWSAATGAAGYEISRATASTGAYSVVGTPTATNFTNTNLTMGSTYYYKARSYVLESGKKVYSAYTSVISIKAAVPAPGSVKAASASYNSVKITWAATSGATGYEVWRADTSGGTYKLIKAVTALNYTNTSLTTGKTYYYKVKAYRKAGTAKVYGSYSSAVSAKPVPAVPGSFKAAKASASSIKLSWSSVSGANGYMIYRATSSAGKYTLIKTLTSKTYTDTKLTKNKTYYYKVCAYKTVSGKKICGLFTAIKSAKPY
jgi:fibronectin type 3 domain-containing protein